MSDKLDEILATVTEIKVQLAVHDVLHKQNTKDLEHHIKRTDLLEASMKPLKQTDTVLRASAKVIATVSSAAGLIYTIINILSKV